MAHDGQESRFDTGATPTESFLPDGGVALTAASSLLGAATDAVRAKVSVSGRVDPEAMDRHQHAAHALAWLATCVESLRQIQDWAHGLDRAGALGEVEVLIHRIAFGEYLAQIAGGIPMSQGEMARPSDMGVGREAEDFARVPEVRRLIANGNTAEARQRLAGLMREGRADTTLGRSGLDDDLEMIRDQFRRFARERIEPSAHQWHLADELIPMEIIREMSDLGVFGLTIPEEYGGLGLSKTTMCVLSEELSRGYIGVGSLGTRSEIAAELILGGGTEAQKRRWLPALASGEILPTAVFTEPGTGSDLASLRTRAVRDGEDWVVTGNKTWITHAARANLMTLLVRTDPEASDWRGLSMFLAEKTPGTREEAFPDDRITGGEIGVLGYRGMREYEIGFDGFRVSGDSLLGGVPGQGFKQLMRTFESARIQTAARAIGVAQSALDLGLQYAEDRKQFGRSLVEFPRVAGKLAMMAVEIMVTRQLTYFAARQKDRGHRCDLEAGMAKLLAARVAWAAADNALQTHGGNGFALEYPVSRILCDARVLNIFEGAAEIQAQVIARRLLG